jgi:hypothetical protein
MGNIGPEQLAALQGANPGLLTGNAFGSADMVQQQGLLAPNTQAPMEAMMADGSMGNTLESGGMTANPMTGGYDRLNPLQRMGQGLEGAFGGMKMPSMGGMGKGMGNMGNGLMPGEWDEWEKQNPMNLLALLQRRRFGG